MTEEELVKAGINHFVIMRLSSNVFGVRLRNERGVLHIWDSIAESLEIPLDQMKNKIAEFGGCIDGGFICFNTKPKIEKFVAGFLEPRLVLVTLADVKVEPKSWG